MLGLNLNFKKTIQISLLFFSWAVFAHVPYPSQIYRFQPALIKTEPSFTTSGKVIIGPSTISTELKWYGSENYDLILENVPAIFHRLENQSSAWVLKRRGTQCLIKAYNVSVNCGAPRFWALMEFSSDVVQIGNALVNEGLYSREDTQWVESDGRQSVPSTTNKTKLVLSNIGSRPTAALEISGYDSNFIQFDQTFLKPIMAKVKDNGEPVTISGQADLEVRRGKPRFSYVIFNRVEILKGSEAVTFTRTEPKPGKITKGPESLQSIGGLDALEEHLSSQGKRLLQAILLTH